MIHQHTNLFQSKQILHPKLLVLLLLPQFCWLFQHRVAIDKKKYLRPFYTFETIVKTKYKSNSCKHIWEPYKIHENETSICWNDEWQWATETGYILHWLQDGIFEYQFNRWLCLLFQSFVSWLLIALLRCAHQE